MKRNLKSDDTFIYEISLPVEGHLDFVSTIHSHGWIDLPPFARLPDRTGFERLEVLPPGGVAALEVSAPGDYPQREISIRVRSVSPLLESALQLVKQQVAHMLRLDEDFSDFYALCRRKGLPWRDLTCGRGRLLRSPTVFEDLVKVICTTNVQWSGTRRMVAELVSAFGQPALHLAQGHSFPIPTAIARVSPDQFAARVRLGYRAAYIHRLAGDVASGKLDPQSWLEGGLPTEEVRRQMLAIKGVGRYAAASMLMLLGRYDDLPVDSEFQKFMSEKYFNGGVFDLEKAQEVYREWGSWKYLAYWMEMIHSED